VDEPKGDPGNTLTRSELEQKGIAVGGIQQSSHARRNEAAFSCKSGNLTRHH